MATVRIEIDGDCAKVYSPYEPERVNIIKTAPDRLWRKDAGRREVPPSAVPALKAALEAYGDTVIVTAYDSEQQRWEAERKLWEKERAKLEREKQRFYQQVTRLKNEAAAANGRNWAEELLSRLGPDRAEKAHKALALVLHPDLGGDTELMKELNVARGLLSGLFQR